MALADVDVVKTSIWTKLFASEADLEKEAHSLVQKALIESDLSLVNIQASTSLQAALNRDVLPIEKLFTHTLKIVSMIEDYEFGVIPRDHWDKFVVSERALLKEGDDAWLIFYGETIIPCVASAMYSDLPLDMDSLDFQKRYFLSSVEGVLERRKVVQLVSDSLRDFVTLVDLLFRENLERPNSLRESLLVQVKDFEKESLKHKDTFNALCTEALDRYEECVDLHRMLLVLLRDEGIDSDSFLKNEEIPLLYQERIKNALERID